MPFVNEYISDADRKKYHLTRICGAHNEAQPGRMYSRTWTIDRQDNIFLIQVWSHPHSLSDGWAFFWKGEWLFFEVVGAGEGGPQPDGSCWFGYKILNFSLPIRLSLQREYIVSDLTRAFGDYCGGGVFSTYSHGTATLYFEQ